MLQVHTIALDEIYVPVSRRKSFDLKTAETLAEDILENGMRIPIQVRQDGARYVLVDGQHRVEAAKLLGEKTIQALFVQARRS